MTEVEVWTYCDRCNGVGEVPIVGWECGKCDGKGRYLETKEIDVEDVKAWEQSFE